MNTVKIEIVVDQKAAIMMGKKQYGAVVIEIDPAELTTEQRETLAACETNLHSGEYIPRPQHYRYNLPAVGEATVETAKMLLDALAVEKRRLAEKAVAEREAKVARALTLPLDAFRYGGGGWKNEDWRFRDYEIEGIADDPRLAGKIAEAKAEIARLNAGLAISREESKKRRAEMDRVEAEKEKAEQRAENEKRARQKAQIAAWVAAHGTDNQKKRAALNLLPEEEIINSIRDDAFAPLANFARYEKIQKSDIPCTCDDYDEPKIKFSAGAETEATAEDFDRMEQIQTILPAAKLTLRWHRGYCETCSDPEDDNDGVFERHSIMVALTVGEFDFTREYAV